MEYMQTVQQPTLATAVFSQEYAIRWVQYLDASESTVKAYTRAIKQFIRWLVDNSIVQPIKENIIQFRDEMKATHKATTAQAYLMAVKQFFRWLADEHLYPNIAEKVKSVKIDKGFKKDYLASAQLKDLLAGIDTSTVAGKRDKAIIMLMAICGLRTIEVNRANIEDIRALGDNIALYVQGKGHNEKAEPVILPPVVYEAIKDYLKARAETISNAPLFVSVSNHNAAGRITTKSISRLTANKLTAAGMKTDRITAHSMRHSAITLALKANNGNVQEAMQFARHTNINTTMLYAHNLEKENNTCSRSVANMVCC